MCTQSSTLEMKNNINTNTNINININTNTNTNLNTNSSTNINPDINTNATNKINKLSNTSKEFIPKSFLQNEINASNISKDKKMNLNKIDDLYIKNDNIVPFPKISFNELLCHELERYFSDLNLKNDLFLLKNMDLDGYINIDILLYLPQIRKLTNNPYDIIKTIEISTKLILSLNGRAIGRKEPILYKDTYHGKLSRTAIAYNLPENSSIALLKNFFSICGTIDSLQLLKKSNNIGRNALLKPPVLQGDTYAIIEYSTMEMAKKAVLTLTNQTNWRMGMQIVLFDGMNAEDLKSTDSNSTSNTTNLQFSPNITSIESFIQTDGLNHLFHIDYVGEGLDDLMEGKVETGKVFSIRGAGGLICPTRYKNSYISFRMVLDEYGQYGIQQGDYISFTVGKNKKSNRKYASKVVLEYRPPINPIIKSNIPMNHLKGFHNKINKREKMNKNEQMVPRSRSDGIFDSNYNIINTFDNTINRRRSASYDTEESIFSLPSSFLNSTESLYDDYTNLPNYTIQSPKNNKIKEKKNKNKNDFQSPKGFKSQQKPILNYSRFIGRGYIVSPKQKGKKGKDITSPFGMPLLQKSHSAISNRIKF